MGCSQDTDAAWSVHNLDNCNMAPPITEEPGEEPEPEYCPTDWIIDCPKGSSEFPRDIISGQWSVSSIREPWGPDMCGSANACETDVIMMRDESGLFMNRIRNICQPHPVPVPEN